MRKSRFTEEQIALALRQVDAGVPSTVMLHAAADLVAHGMPVSDAARTKGASRASLRRWMAERERFRPPSPRSP